ncbi:MAG: hypothetical protein TRG1_727 [Flavobacteriaceae bacterium FS1-H7996/R]|nr:MAG: hypothetical protein TRG1_727 [Flavobacteriaceae bacterium FS1-H7996/R]
MKRKSVVFCPIEDFLELHSIVEWTKKSDFFSQFGKAKPLHGINLQY